MSPALPPAHTLGPTSVNRMNLTAFARYFVTAEMAATIPEGSLDVVLDLVIQLRALRAHYADYQLLTSRASIDLARLPVYLTAETRAALNNEKRRHLEQLVASEAAQINAGIAGAIAFLDKQLAHLSPDDAAMNALIAARRATYATHPKPRPARRVKSQPQKQAA